MAAPDMSKDDLQKTVAAVWDQLNQLAETDRPKYDEFVQKTLKDGLEAGVDKGTYIVPEPGVILKLRDATGAKIMMNLCSHERIDAPAPMQVPGGAPDETQMRFPMSSGERRVARDKSGAAECFVWDVVLHPTAVALTHAGLGESSLLLVEVLVQCYEKRFGVAIPRELSNFTFLRRRKYYDPPVRSQYVQDRTSGPQVVTSAVAAAEARGEALLSALSSAPLVDGKRVAPGKPLMGGASAAKSSATGSGEKATGSTSTERPRFVLDIQRGAGGRPVTLVLTVAMPRLADAREPVELTLDLNRATDALTVRAAGTYALTVDLPFQADGDAARARFKRAQRELVIELPVLGPL